MFRLLHLASRPGHGGSTPCEPVQHVLGGTDADNQAMCLFDNEVSSMVIKIACANAGHKKTAPVAIGAGGKMKYISTAFTLQRAIRASDGELCIESKGCIRALCG